MNREIKFRIWDGKKFHYPECELEKTNHYLQFGSNGVFFLHNADGDYITGSKDGGIAEQFTGVMHRDCEKYKNKEFDKNGNAFYKEVFEGDIVEFKVDPSFYIKAKLGDRYIIEYFGAGFFMKPISWGNKKIDAQNYVGLLPPYQTSNMRNHYEVIGNIHENTDLLK